MPRGAPVSLDWIAISIFGAHRVHIALGIVGCPRMRQMETTGCRERIALRLLMMLRRKHCSQQQESLSRPKISKTTLCVPSSVSSTPSLSASGLPPHCDRSCEARVRPACPLLPPCGPLFQQLGQCACEHPGWTDGAIREFSRSKIFGGEVWLHQGIGTTRPNQRLSPCTAQEYSVLVCY